MELTATSLSELIRSLRSQSVGAGEKRKESRVGLRVKVIVLLNNGQQSTAWVRDVSASGLGIVSAHRFEVGENIGMMLGTNMPVSCQVLHCRRVGSDLFSAGLKFTDYDPKTYRPTKMESAKPSETAGLRRV